MTICVQHGGLDIELDPLEEDGTCHFGVSSVRACDGYLSLAEVGAILSNDRRAIEMAAERQLMIEQRDAA